MTGQVIAVLPSGNLVLEAQRKIFMNNQHEDVTIRGVVRPNDIGPNNTVTSSALSNLEIEMKGKGIIADSTRPLNPMTTGNPLAGWILMRMRDEIPDVDTAKAGDRVFCACASGRDGHGRQRFEATACWFAISPASRACATTCWWATAWSRD